MSYEPDYYNCSPCDFESQSPEEYGWRWDHYNLEYVRIEDDPIDSEDQSL